jgi:hypothetical protein
MLGTALIVAIPLFFTTTTSQLLFIYAAALVVLIISSKGFSGLPPVELTPYL